MFLSCSCHDPKILDGIFIGFVNRAYAICDDKYIEKELQFLINVFAENEYDINRLKSLIKKFNQKREVPNENSNSDPDQRMIVSLPWVPGLSLKLRKTFRKSNIKAVFKSSANLKTILTLKNKTKLPDLTSPGVYKIDCKCSVLRR